MNGSNFLYCSDGGPPPPASPLGSIQPDLYQRRDGPLYLKARGYMLYFIRVRNIPATVPTKVRENIE